jgi:alpha-D-ribose 1-methylphosphonate 5-triphosphate diphosphatase
LVLREGALVEDALTLEDGRIAAGAGAEADLGGFWLLPGIVDLHGDGFERHLAPRSGVGFDMGLGLASVDAELCANGVTTAYLAQCFSWEGGKRGADCAEAVLAARAAHPARADMRVQLRYETHFVEGAERLAALVRSGAVGYVVFNNHVPDALALWARSPEIVAAWAGESRRGAAEHMALVEAAAARGPEVPASLARLAAEFRAAGARMGSHDDPDAATRARFDALGAHVCEFPTTREAAAEAKARGNPVLMGAPNVVRGGSQAGNVSAEALVAEGLCDALVSDYYYPALAAAVWALADRGTLGFAQGWRLVSENPARVMGLDDRGALREGARADLLAMNPATRRVEAVFVAGWPVHLAGEAAERLIGRRGTLRAVARAGA